MVQLAFALLKAPLSETAALGSWDQPLLAAACCEQQADVVPEELFQFVLHAAAKIIDAAVGVTSEGPFPP